MGTRADFYVGKGKDAEWIGSIGWDGYPSGIDEAVLQSTTPEEFREAVAKFFAGRRDATLPADGWPWPWNDSCTTDYAYAIFDGSVKGSSFGHQWFDARQGEPEEDDESEDGIGGAKMDDFPDMTALSNFTLGPRSGTIVVGG